MAAICVKSFRVAMDAKKLFGLCVKGLREAAGISQEELGMRIGTDQAYVSRIEAGMINPTLETMVEIAKALGVDLVDLFKLPEDK